MGWSVGFKRGEVGVVADGPMSRLNRPAGMRESEGEGALEIVVVEDHPDTRKYLVMFLRQLGHRVRAAGSVRDARELLAAEGCDVLISDLGLPDGSGWDLLVEVESGAVRYAIAMSGFGTMSDRTRSSESGFRRHLLKPFDLDDLADALADAASELSG